MTSPTGSSTPREALPWPEQHIAELRRYHNPCGWSCSASVDNSECQIARWLATVDAALAAQASSDYPHTDHGCYGATDPRCRARNCVCRCHAQASSEAPDRDDDNAEGYCLSCHRPWPWASSEAGSLDVDALVAAFEGMGAITGHQAAWEVRTRLAASRDA